MKAKMKQNPNPVVDSLVFGLASDALPGVKKANGPALVWGKDRDLISAQITNIPGNASKVRVRFRSKQPALAFVRTPIGITSYYLRRKGDEMILAEICEANVIKASITVQEREDRSVAAVGKR